MSVKLYVGNLPFNTTETEVLEMFRGAGEVARCNLIVDRIAGRSKGFAFVEMGSRDEGLKAISRFNGREVNGRPLTVNEARPREDRERS
jgi:cold-inducible RNA-binding protein